MTFKPGDKVICDGNGPYILHANKSSSYPLKIKNDTFTSDGRRIDNGPIRLKLYEEEKEKEKEKENNVKTYPLGQVQTLDNGIQIYHPTNGQPFQLIPTTKALLC